MGKIDDFFISKNTVKGITEEHYKTNQIDSLIKMADAISRITCHSLYIIDYHKKNFLYVSDNKLFLNDVSADEVKKMGYMFYLNHVPKEEVEMLLEINQPFYWEYSFKSRRWNERREIVLNEREKDILTLSVRGYTMNDIADELCMSIDTVKFHKKKLFEKLQVKNITEALYFATNHKLI